MLSTCARWTLVLGSLFLTLAAGCGGKGKDHGEGQQGPSDDPVLNGIAPQAGSFGTIVTLNGHNFESTPDGNTVVLKAPAQGTVEIKPIAASADQIRFIVPAAYAESAQISVRVDGRDTTALPFEIRGLVDPTSSEAANEVDAFHSALDTTLASVIAGLDQTLAPALEANGQQAEVTQLRTALAHVRAGFDQMFGDAKGKATPEQLAAMDALMASEAFARALQRLNDVSDKLAATASAARARNVHAQAVPVEDDGGLLAGLRTSMKSLLAAAGLDGMRAQDVTFAGDAMDAAFLEDIRNARTILVELRDILDDLNDALIAAEVAAGAAAVAGGSTASLIPVLEGIRTVVKTVITVLDFAIRLLDLAPTQVVGDTLAVSLGDNNLYLNQRFGSMREPVPPEMDPGHMLVLEPYGVTGTVDFHNNNGVPLNELLEQVIGGANPVADALLEFADFEVGAITLTNVKVKLTLTSDRPDLFQGAWRSGQLWISALAPGEGIVNVRADLEQIVPTGEPCPIVRFGGENACIHPEDLEVSRRMRAYAGTQTSGPYVQGPRLLTAQVAGLPPGQAYIGDSLHITGEGFTRDAQLAHQDVYFDAPVDGYSEGTTGLAWSIHEDNEDYFGFDVEVPDALSGPLNVSLNTHPSNELDFTILPPHLDAPHPSAIVGEAWSVTGRGFSHTLTRNEGNWNGGRRAPYDPRGEAAHRALDFIVPESAQSGPFNVVTLGQLISNSHEVAARRFSEPVTLSATGRAGLRPAVARDGSNGDRIVAWIDHSNRGGNQLVASVVPANSTAFGTPVVVAADLGGLPGAPPRPAVAAASGVFYIAWVADVGGNYEIAFASSLDGLTWSAPRYLSNSPGSSLQPALAADGSIVTVAWIEEGAELDDASLRFRISRNGGVDFSGFSWSAGDVADPAVAVRGQAIAVAWIADHDPLVMRSNDAGVTMDPIWRAARNSDGTAHHPSVAIGRSCVASDVNSVYVAWENGPIPGVEEDVFFARWDATTFTAPLNVSGTATYSRSPALTVDGDCTPALAWIEQGLPSNTLRSNGVDGVSQPFTSALRFARSFDDGASFKAPYMRLLDKNDGSRLGHLAMVGAERALLTYVYQNDVGGTPAVMMSTTEGTPAPASAQPTASGEMSTDLVYRGFYGGTDGGGIYVSRADGTHLQRVFRHASTSQTVALSPDGRHIAVVPSADRLMVAEADGAYPLYVAVTADFVMRGGAYWSPRGDYIGIACFWNSCPNYGPLLGWVMQDARDLNLVGYGGAPSSVAGFAGMQPWSPQGTLIYSNGTFGRVDPAVRNGQPIAVTLPSGKRGYYPAWSPDGARIAFIASDDPEVDPAQGLYGYGNLYVMNADGSNAVELTNGDETATPVWSPDGTKIAYVSRRSGHQTRRVFMLSASGQLDSGVDLASNPLLFDDSMPAFLPDGSAVVIHRRNAADNTSQLIVVNPHTPTLYSPYSPSGFAGHPAAFHLGMRPTWTADANMTTQAIGTTSAMLSWSGANDDTGVAYYRLYDGNTLLESNIAASSESFTVSGLTPATSYTLNVRACDAAGNCSLSGPSVTFTTAGAGPAPTWSVVPPTFRTPMVYDSYSVSLDWTSANEPGVEYRLYRNGVLWQPPSPGQMVGFVTGLRPQTDYVFRVEACFAGGGSCTTDGPTLAYRTPADTSRLDLQTSNVLVSALTLNFNDPPNDAFVPAAADFTVTVNDTAVAVTEVDVHPDAKELVLTLAEPAYAGDVVVLSYIPGASPIQDFGGNELREVSYRAVENFAQIQGNGAATDAAGNIYVAGSFVGAVKFGTHVLIAAGNIDAYLAKRDAAGVWQWARRIGSTGGDAAYAVTVDASHVYLGGVFEGEVDFGAQTMTANGVTDLFVAKLDHAGNWVWAARAGGAPPINPDTGYPGDALNGLPFPEVANSVAVDGAGNVYVAGSFAGAATFGASGLSIASTGPSDLVVAKLDAAGAWQWAARAGSANGDVANGVAVDSTGVYITGQLGGAAEFGSDVLQSSGLFVAKLDASGAWQWADDGNTVSAGGYSIVTDGSGSVYVAGYNGVPVSRPFVGRWNAAGVVQWTQLLSGSGHGLAYGLTRNGDGNLYASGRVGGSFVLGSTPVFMNGAFVARIDTSGAWQWALGSDAFDSKSIASCGVGAVCAFGNYARTATFGALPSLTSGGGNDIYIVRAGNTGNPPAGEWLSLSNTRNAP
jgi:Putative flagellar system-associated repeat/IPT/TIG domain/Fibronectin type III domain/WD40-like Beta Propeller Repeat